MENRLQATFMPRQSPVLGGSSSRPKAPTNFLMMIGVLVLVLVLVAMGGLFGYKGFLESGNKAKQTKVQEAIKSFEPELTKELTILKTRIDAGKNLLDNHKAFSLLFTLLELNTAKTVQFKEFTYSTSQTDKSVKLSMKGEARSYNAIAFQSDIFSKVEQLKNPMFNNIELSETGSIKFDFSADLDPATVSYKKIVSELPPSAAPSTFTAPPTTSTTTGATSGVTTGGTTGSTTRRTNQPGS